MSRKYKAPLKNCENCRRLNYCIRKEEEKEFKDYFCKIFKDHFISKCDKKVKKD